MPYIIKGCSRETGKVQETITTYDGQGTRVPMVFESEGLAKNWIDMFGQFIALDFKIEKMNS